MCSLSEICAVSKVSKKEIGRCFKLIKRAVETKVGQVVSTDFMVRSLSICQNHNCVVQEYVFSFSLASVQTLVLALMYSEQLCTLQRKLMN